jgi:pyruvate/2-oxoglutarate dehydrogenase complex dihydrolipoamide acyltransferase (E2) component
MSLQTLKAMLLLSLPLLAACATTAPTAPVATTPAPTDTVRKTTALIPAEDLTKYRPTFAPASATPAPGPPAAAPRAAIPPAPKAAPVPTNAVTAQVEQRLRDQAFTNQNVKYTSGYRVRAYLGLERAQAMTVRRQVIGRYPEETDYITFKQPVYRLYIGDYTTRLEAARGLARVRQFAPKAELEPMQVLLNKTP